MAKNDIGLSNRILRYFYDRWFSIFGDVNRLPGFKLVLQSRGDVDKITITFTNDINNIGISRSTSYIPMIQIVKLPDIMSTIKKDIDRIKGDRTHIKTIYELALDLYSGLEKNKDVFMKSFSNVDIENINRMKDHNFGVAFYTYCAASLLNILAELSVYVSILNNPQFFNDDLFEGGTSESRIHSLIYLSSIQTKRYVIVKGVVEFMKQPQFKKDIEAGYSMQREALLGEDFTAVFGSILLVAFIIQTLRLMIEVIYYSRSEVAKWLELQATYLELNATIVERQNRPDDKKVVERQRIIVEKMRHLAKFMKINNEKMEDALKTKQANIAIADKELDDNSQHEEEKNNMVKSKVYSSNNNPSEDYL